MPIYEYVCSSCRHELEALQKFSDPLLTSCPSCGTESLTKKISAAGFQLKGSGWYATDFKGSGSSKPKEKDKADGNGEAKPDKSETSDKSEKSEAKSEAAPACGAGACAACS